MQSEHASTLFDPGPPPTRWQRLLKGQDPIAQLAPLAAVLLFLAAIVSAFWYLRLEETRREQEAVKRDVEYSQQRLRLRLLERQEQLMRLARELADREMTALQFDTRAEAMVAQYPELRAVSWIDGQRRLRTTQAAPSVSSRPDWLAGDRLKPGDASDGYELAQDLRQAVYSQPLAAEGSEAVLYLHVPITPRAQFAGVVLAEYSVDGLLRHGVPAEVLAKYAVSLLDAKGQLLAGQTIPDRTGVSEYLPWTDQVNAFDSPVSPVGNGLVLRAQAWRTSQGVVGGTLFWLVAVLATMTAWMLIANWRQSQRRQQAQQALLAETSFRRAMENSMLTGMRALDLQGRIVYVNPAFCQMTGWSEAELIGQSEPFSYWPDAHREELSARLKDELSGAADPAGFQMSVKRKNGSLFDARLYVSPLIDATGKHTGWMASMTDITEPNRVRHQLSASYERFTTVLEALDASVSVAPLGSEELLFANKLYRLWFGSMAAGHLQLVEQAGMPEQPISDDALDDVDGLAGLPTGALTAAKPENAEIYVPKLGKWLEVRSRYLNWVDGRLAQMVIATDITPRRMAEELSAAQAERAQSASRLITMGEMASSMAHELNQPLTAINNYCSGMVSRIKGKQISDKDLLGALEKTARQAQRAGQIIQRIRTFVKRSEPNRTLAEVPGMVAEALELAEIEFRRRNVRLTHHIAARLPTLQVDPILIEQVLVNLLKNAAESIDAAHRPTSRRHVELRVVPRVESEQRVVEFSVTDTGQGLAPEVLDRLFEAFFSTKAEGMGIGLNLCRSIVESHHGRMQARNLYNGQEVVGCCFSFWIPVSDSQQTDAFKDSGVTA